jgi:hypothetical protein
METKEVTLSGKTITLGAPASLAMRWDIACAVHSAPRRVMWAALAICWRSLSPPKTNFQQCQYDLALFGGKVMDELLERGHDFTEVNTAAIEAYVLATKGLLTDREVKEAESFTEAPAEDPHA